MSSSPIRSKKIPAPVWSRILNYCKSKDYIPSRKNDSLRSQLNEKYQIPEIVKNEVYGGEALEILLEVEKMRQELEFFKPTNTARFSLFLTKVARYEEDKESNQTLNIDKSEILWSLFEEKEKGVWTKSERKKVEYAFKILTKKRLWYISYDDSFQFSYSGINDDNIAHFLSLLRQDKVFLSKPFDKWRTYNFPVICFNEYLTQKGKISGFCSMVEKQLEVPSVNLFQFLHNEEMHSTLHDNYKKYLVDSPKRLPNTFLIGENCELPTWCKNSKMKWDVNKNNLIYFHEVMKSEFKDLERQKNDLLEFKICIPPRIVELYASEDSNSPYLKEFQTHLKALRRDENLYDLEIINQHEILAGGSLDEEMNKAINDSDLAIVYISPNFFTSINKNKPNAYRWYKYLCASNPRIDMVISVVLSPTISWEDEPLYEGMTLGGRVSCPREGSLSNAKNREDEIIKTIKDIRTFLSKSYS